MESRYVVEVDVLPAEASALPLAEVRTRVVDHLAEWLSFEHTPGLEAAAFG